MQVVSPVLSVTLHQGREMRNGKMAREVAVVKMEGITVGMVRKEGGRNGRLKGGYEVFKFRGLKG